MRSAGGLTVTVGEAGKLVSTLFVSKSETEKPVRGADHIVDLLLPSCLNLSLKIKAQVSDNVGHTSPPVRLNIKHIVVQLGIVAKCPIEELRGCV